MAADSFPLRWNDGLPGVTMPLFDYPVAVFITTILVLLIAHEAGYRARPGIQGRDAVWMDQIREIRNFIGLLLSLLIGFAMSMALTIYNQREQLIVEEAGAIQSAYLSSTLQDDAVRLQSASLFDQYLKTRIAALDEDTPLADRTESISQSMRIQRLMWKGLMQQAPLHPSPIVAGYAEALKQMFGHEAAQNALSHNRVPLDIWILLSLLSIMISIVSGYGEQRRMLISGLIPALMIATALCLMADLSSPVSGFIHVRPESLRAMQANLELIRTRQGA
ncbi:hypothetical protein [Dyella sp. RRB7]|uniref:bestrophin-like domain n=1 Tax=Dyella sp. RRB7 TaxID=2919502 RepID=UPI001FA9C29E|nr:hypothetical protein [Dyella sp. RRB7]